MADKPIYDESIEQALLSALMLDAETVFPQIPFISEKSFYREAHKLIYKSMRALYDENRPVDPITISNQLEKDGTLKRAGGKDAIGYLMDVVPTAANCQQYAKIVEDHARRRYAEQIAYEILEAVRTPEAELSKIVKVGFDKLLPLAIDDSQNGYRRLDPYTTITQIEERGANPKSVILTGYKCIDDVFHGFRGGELVIVGGSAKGGKTAFTLNMARNIAGFGHGVGFQSCEMSREALTERLLNREAQVHVRDTASGNMDSSAWTSLAKAGDILARLPIEVDDTAMPDIDDVTAKVMALKARMPNLKAVVVDFLQLVTADVEGKNEAGMLAYVSYRLKQLARNADVVLFAPCQLNHKQIDGESREPELRDLQGSSGMAQAADAVLLVWRTGGGVGAFAPPERFHVKCAASRRTETFKATMNWKGRYMYVEEVDSYTGEVTSDPQN